MVNNVWTIMVTIIISFLPSLITANTVNNSINIYTSLAHRHIQTTIHQYSFPERADDGISKVVIDAGHGGHDPGTKGAHSFEKEIALQIALKFGESLNKKHPEIQVIYTRKSDTFIPLHERIAIANRNKADLFISIHCNYADNPSVCGSETFVMGLHRADDNLKVAKRENAVVLMENNFEKNYDGYDPNSPVGHILLSMYQNAFLDKSIGFASSVESSLEGRADYNSRGVKQAGFVVLREATMPSVLVETGFLSNPKEEKYLMSNNGQLEMASKLTHAVHTYFENHVAENKAFVKVKNPKKTKQLEVPAPSPQPIIAYGQEDMGNKGKGSYTQKVKTASGATTIIGKKDVHTSVSKSSKATAQKTITIAENTIGGNDDMYTIQIGVFSKSKKDYFSKYKEVANDIIELIVNNKYKYVIGKFYNKEEALRACLDVKKVGLNDAFVTELKF